MGTYSKAIICQMFNITLEQLNEQYRKNSEVLAGMRDKAIKTGKKVGHYTADQLTEMTDKYQELSQ